MNNSKVFWGKIWHRRHAPKVHDFTYSIFSFALDLDQLKKLDHLAPFLGINRSSIFSIWEKDYLGGGLESLKSRVLTCAKVKLNLDPLPTQVILVTMPKFFGYVFNPVSFYLLLNAKNEVTSLVTEVSNTFGESHLYFANALERRADGSTTFSFPKQFFVSPFLDVEGHYKLSLHPYGDKLDIEVALFREELKIFEARLFGQGAELTRLRILKTLLYYPLTALLSMTKIHIEALRLFLLKKASVYKKPGLLTADTTKYCRSIFHKLRLWLLSLTKQKEISYPANISSEERTKKIV